MNGWLGALAGKVMSDKLQFVETPGADLAQQIDKLEFVGHL